MTKCQYGRAVQWKEGDAWQTGVLVLDADGNCITWDNGWDGNPSVGAEVLVALTRELVFVPWGELSDYPQSPITGADEMSKPKRVQRQRTKGYKLPPNTVCVTRPGRWGNPFSTAGEFRSLIESMFGFTGQSQFYAVTLDEFAHVNYIANHIGELRGKNLACFCPLDKPCHADVLLELANKEPTKCS